MRRKWLHFAYFSFIFATLIICLDMIVSRLSGGSWWWKSVKFRRKKLREFRSFLWTLLIDNFLLKLFINILNILIFSSHFRLFFLPHIYFSTLSLLPTHHFFFDIKLLYFFFCSYEISKIPFYNVDQL